MLTATLSPTGKALSRSPIKLSIVSDSPTTYTVSIAGSEVYKGSGVGSYYVFLQDIIDPYITQAPVSPDDDDYLTSVSGNTVAVTISVVNEDNNSKTFSLSVYKGGISSQEFRSLGATSYFSTLFLTGSARFFTTRGRNAITLRRSELAPLLFIYGTSCVVQYGSSSEVLTGSSGHLCALNIAAIARDHPTVTTFNVVMDNAATPFAIHIAEDRPSRNELLVRFLNSLGWYEYVLFNGAADYGQRNDTDGDYTQYDSVTDSYPVHRGQQTGHGVITAHCGYRSQEELLFLLDLANSADVELIGFRGKNVNVVPSCDGYSVRLQDNKPGDLTFTFTLCDESTTAL